MKHSAILVLALTVALSAGLPGILAQADDKTPPTTGVANTLAQPVKTQAISGMIYSPETGVLTIETADQTPLTADKVTHHPRRKEVVFFFPASTVQPTPKQITVKEDPIVKGVRMEQRAINGVPAVRVSVDLYTNAPLVPFNLESVQPGSRLTFGRKAAEPIKSEPAEVTPAGGAAPIQPRSIQLQGERTTAPVNNRLTLAAAPGNTTMSFTAADKSAVATATTDSVVGPVDSATVSIIQDIFYEDDNLTVVSQKTPISVKRSFLLTEPNRYVVDISPAVLANKSLTRAIPQTNPRLVSLKAGQFDEKTVRIVAQFSQGAAPVDLSQWDNNRVLKLTFY